MTKLYSNCKNVFLVGYLECSRYVLFACIDGIMASVCLQLHRNWYQEAMPLMQEKRTHLLFHAVIFIQLDQNVDTFDESFLRETQCSIKAGAVIFLNVCVCSKKWKKVNVHQWGFDVVTRRCNRLHKRAHVYFFHPY